MSLCIRELIAGAGAHNEPLIFVSCRPLPSICRSLGHSTIDSHNKCVAWWDETQGEFVDYVVISLILRDFFPKPTQRGNPGNHHFDGERGLVLAVSLNCGQCYSLIKATDGLVQDYSFSIVLALAMEILQSCTRPTPCCILRKINFLHRIMDSIYQYKVNIIATNRNCANVGHYIYTNTVCCERVRKNVTRISY